VCASTVAPSEGGGVVVVSMEPIRVLIVDDHPLFREGVHALLNSIPEEFEVVGEAKSGEEAIVRAADLKPHVVIMDIEMPGV